MSEFFNSHSLLHSSWREKAKEKRTLAHSAVTCRLTPLFIGGAVAYWAVPIPCRLSIFRFLYAGKYVESSYLVPLFALEAIFWTVIPGVNHGDRMLASSPPVKWSQSSPSKRYTRSQSPSIADSFRRHSGTP
jgi:hypothetical protein